MLTLTRILIPVTFFDVRTGRFIRAFGAAWWLLFEELPQISSVPTLILPTPEPSFASWISLINYLAGFLHFIVFVLVLAFILMFQALIRLFNSALANLIFIFDFLLGLLPERQAPNHPLFVTVINHQVTFGHTRRAFSTSAIFFSLSSQVPEGPSLSRVQPNPLNQVQINPGDTIQEGFRAYWTYISPITSGDFFDKLEVLIKGLTSDPSRLFAIIIQPEFSSGQRRTLGHSFHINCEPKMNDLRDWLQPLIDNFEAQSGGDELGPLSLRTFISITDITGIPEPEARPISSSPANVAHIKTVRDETKRATDRSRKAAPTVSAIASLESKLDTGFKEMIQAIKSQPSAANPAPSPLGGVNWTPIIQGLITGVASSLGASVNFPTTTQASVPAEAPTTLDLSPVLTRLNKLESKYSNLETSVKSLASTVETLAKGQANMTNSVSSLAQTLEAFIKASTPSNSSNNSNDSTPAAPSSSSPITPPVASTPSLSKANLDSLINEGKIVLDTYDASNLPSLEELSIKSKKSPPVPSLEEITSLKEDTTNRKYEDLIVTADLESLVNKDGSNSVYMAAWYSGKSFKVYDITNYSMNSNKMLSDFWLDLINQNKGKIAYFHNWAGYDSILSLSPLVNLPDFNFQPVIHDGQVISVKIEFNNKLQLTIIDSIKLLPSSLAKLAKDWKVESQKEHFPHYFNPLELYGNLNWKGALPSYEYFEPKRTSFSDYEEMQLEFKNKPWSFLEVSRDYIKSDCRALFQILVKFFNTLVSKFPINPLGALSIPALAFKTWRTVQLPLLNKDGFKVFDLARTLDSKLRGAYLGGTTLCYKFHN